MPPRPRPVRGRRRARLYLEFASRVRPSQVLGRLRRRVPADVFARSLPRGTTRWRTLPPGVGLDPSPQSGPGVPPHVGGTYSAYGQRWSVAPADWEALQRNPLLAFHVHGFEALPEYIVSARSRRGDQFWIDVTCEWINRFGDRPDEIAWHPFPTSNRLIGFSSYIGRSTDPVLDARLADVIRRHGAFLRRRLEYDIGGNHLILNGVALVFAGYACFDDTLMSRGYRLLRREARQFLPDGGHEERSPAYHRLLTARLRDVAALLKHAGLAHLWLDDLLIRADAWLREMCGPDGMVAQFNDAWGGPPLAPSGLSPFAHLSDTGFVVLRRDADQVIFDCGPLGPRHIPAHAHADALSFVLWLDGRLLIIDPGTCLYTGPTRDVMRGTAAHSTVAVDGHDQCLYWADFRYACDPRVELRRIEWIERDTAVVVGRHDGYRRLPDPVTHDRAIIWLPGDGVVVIDRLTASLSHDVRASLPFAPGFRPESLGIEIAPLTGTANLEPRDYAPYLGRLEAIQALVFEQLMEPGVLFGWRILRAGARAALSPDDQVLTVRRSRGDTLSLRAGDLFR